MFFPSHSRSQTLAEKEGGKDDHGAGAVGLTGTIPVVFEQGNETLRTMAHVGQKLSSVASQAGQLYIGIYAEPSMNNVSLPPRHWYTFRLDHTVFDTRDLASGEMRAGCLAYGQWRHYKISTATINDARLDLEVSLGRVRLRLRLSLRVRGPSS